MKTDDIRGDARAVLQLPSNSMMLCVNGKAAREKSFCVKFLPDVEDRSFSWNIAGVACKMTYSAEERVDVRGTNAVLY